MGRDGGTAGYVRTQSLCQPSEDHQSQSGDGHVPERQVPLASTGAYRHSIIEDFLVIF